MQVLILNGTLGGLPSEKPGTIVLLAASANNLCKKTLFRDQIVWVKKHEYMDIILGHAADYLQAEAVPENGC